MARMYDPTTARFLQEDTYRGDVNDPLSLNLYTYCHNEPIMYTDPYGHDPLEMKWIAEQIDKQKAQWNSLQADINKIMNKSKKGALSGGEQTRLRQLQEKQATAHNEANSLRTQLTKVENPNIKGWDKQGLDAQTYAVSISNGQADKQLWNNYKNYLDSLVKKHKSTENLSMTMYVDSPNSGGRDAYNIWNDGPGHAFVSINFSDGTKRYFGFYPNQSLPNNERVHRLLQGVKGEVKDSRSDKGSDESHVYNISYGTGINSQNAKNAFEYAYNFEKEAEMGNDNYKYNLETQNCTTFAVNTMRAANIVTPVREHKWELNIGDRGMFYADQGVNPFMSLYGYNTADAAQDIMYGNLSY